MKKKILCYYLLISTAITFAGQASLDQLLHDLTELQNIAAGGGASPTTPTPPAPPAPPISPGGGASAVKIAALEKQILDSEERNRLLTAQLSTKKTSSPADTLKIAELEKRIEELTLQLSTAAPGGPPASPGGGASAAKIAALEKQILDSEERNRLLTAQLSTKKTSSPADTLKIAELEKRIEELTLQLSTAGGGGGASTTTSSPADTLRIAELETEIEKLRQENQLLKQQLSKAPAGPPAPPGTPPAPAPVGAAAAGGGGGAAVGAKPAGGGGAAVGAKPAGGRKAAIDEMNERNAKRAEKEALKEAKQKAKDELDKITNELGSQADIDAAQEKLTKAEQDLKDWETANPSKNKRPGRAAAGGGAAGGGGGAAAAGGGGGAAAAGGGGGAAPVETYPIISGTKNDIITFKVASKHDFKNGLIDYQKIGILRQNKALEIKEDKTKGTVTFSIDNNEYKWADIKNLTTEEDDWQKGDSEDDSE